MKEIARLALTLPSFSENPTTQAEPSLPAPMPPSTIDFDSVFAAHLKQADREAELRPANKDRLFDALSTAGITHVTVTFDGEGDHLTSDEAIEEGIIANEYTFTEVGRRFG